MRTLLIAILLGLLAGCAGGEFMGEPLPPLPGFEQDGDFTSTGRFSSNPGPNASTVDKYRLFECIVTGLLVGETYNC